jgi:molecular chaperone HtpG
LPKGGLDLGTLEDEAEPPATRRNRNRVQGSGEKMKAALTDKAKDEPSLSITDSPACLVSPMSMTSPAISARMLKAAGQAAPESKPILETGCRIIRWYKS